MSESCSNRVRKQCDDGLYIGRTDAFSNVFQTDARANRRRDTRARARERASRAGDAGRRGNNTRAKGARRARTHGAHGLSGTDRTRRTTTRAFKRRANAMANVRRSARARGAATGKPTATRGRQNSQPLIDLTNRGGNARGRARTGASEARGDGEAKRARGDGGDDDGASEARAKATKRARSRENDFRCTESMDATRGTFDGKGALRV